MAAIAGIMPHAADWPVGDVMCHGECGRPVGWEELAAATGPCVAARPVGLYANLVPSTRQMARMLWLWRSGEPRRRNWLPL